MSKFIKVLDASTGGHVLVHLDTVAMVQYQNPTHSLIVFTHGAKVVVNVTIDELHKQLSDKSPTKTKQQK
jgi:hypothetical protein